MRITLGRPTIVKIAVIAAFALFFSFVSLLTDRQTVMASAFGPSSSHTNAPGEDNCTACHTSFPVNSGSGSVVVAGVPQFYIPGQQIQITVTTSQADAVIYGFQLTAIDDVGQETGTFSLPIQNPAKIQVIPGLVGGHSRKYVEHTVDGLYTDMVFGHNSWTFTWTAPTPSSGTVHFHAAGNAANSDGSTFGDYIYTTFTDSQPSATGPVSISGHVFTSTGAPLRSATVTLTGQSGSVTTTSNIFGVFNFTSVPAGQFYTLTVASKRYRFDPVNIPLTGNLTGVDLTGQE